MTEIVWPGEVVTPPSLNTTNPNTSGLLTCQFVDWEGTIYDVINGGTLGTFDSANQIGDTFPGGEKLSATWSGTAPDISDNPFQLLETYAYTSQNDVTNVDYTVAPSGADYTTLAALHDGVKPTVNRPVATVSGFIEETEDGYGHWRTADFTAGAEFKADPAEYFDGNFAGKATIKLRNRFFIRSEEFYYLRGLVFEFNRDDYLGVDSIRFPLGATQYEVKRIEYSECGFINRSTTEYIYGPFYPDDDGSSILFRSCIAVGFSRAGINGDTGSKVDANNCILVGNNSSDYAYSAGLSDIKATNTVVLNSGNEDFRGCSGDFNISSDGTAPGANSITNFDYTGMFVDPVNDDYRIVDAFKSNLQGLGVNGTDIAAYFYEQPGGGGGTAQDVTLPDLNQATEVQTVSVSALAGITGLEADQDTQTQLGTVAAGFGVVTSDADQDTNSQTATVAADITGDVADAQQQTNGDTATLVTDLDVITTDGEQVTQGDSATVAVDLGVPGTEADQDTDISSGAVAVDLGVQSSQADQDTSVELLTISTDAITTINLVTAEQLHSASTANVSELNTVASVIVQQALGVELMTPAQVGSVSGVPGQSQVQGSTDDVITNVLTDVITADQLTQAQIIDLLDGTGLSVVVVEQGTDFATGDVTIVHSVAVVSSEQGTEGETIRTGAAAVLNVLNIEQMTEAEIADVLGSAMLVNPRSLRVKRTTIGYTVNRKTSAFRVTLKTT